MGGFGSGRRGGRDVTADYRRLDVRKLHRAGVLVPGWIGGWQWSRRGEKTADIGIEVGEGSIRLRYSIKNTGEQKDYDVGLSYTGCNYGGARPWFLCPCCGRRVAVLYGGAVFACRHCYKLAYQVQRESDNNRVARRLDAIRERLGWPDGFLNGDGWKPKGMHWRTFYKLRAEHDQLKGAVLGGWARQFGILQNRLGQSKIG